MSTPATPRSPSRPKAVRARRVWGYHAGAKERTFSVTGDRELAEMSAAGFIWKDPNRVRRVAVLDVSDEAALVEQVAEAILENPSNYGHNGGFKAQARAVLRSLGIIGGRGK